MRRPQQGLSCHHKWNHYSVSHIESMIICPDMKKHREALPYILASLLLVLLITMAQITKAETNKISEASRSDYFYLPVESTLVSRVSEKDYLQLIADFQSAYLPQVIQKTGKPVLILNEWKNPYFSAYSFQRESYFQISLSGGTARAPGATQASLAAIVCHELGHIIGGEPLQTIPGGEWASSEGQADFFAAKICLPNYFHRHPEAQTAGSTDPEIMKTCHGNESCESVAKTGFEVVSFFQRYSYHEYVPVRLETHEKPSTELIRNKYPTDQCRLDTFVGGAICQLGLSCRAPTCWAGVPK